MKKTFLFFFLAGISTVLFSATALAAGATIDTSNVGKGIVTVSLTDFTGKTIKAQVEKGSEKYNYTLTKSPVNLPLQMGTGEYKITVLEAIGGDKYKPIASVPVNAGSIDEKALYTASMPIVGYSVSTTAIPAFKTVTSQRTTDKDKLDAVYSEVVNSISYDLNKAANVKSDYVPNIDSVYTAKKGICYDYAALVGGAMRSQGIPTRLVMGYVPEISEYHAWNEILINGDWISVDATYDSQVVKAGKTYKMEKDKSKTKVVKKY